MGISTFNHFDNFGFKITDGIESRYNILIQLSQTLTLHYDRSINKKNSFSLMLNGFTNEYQSDKFERIRGIYNRNFWSFCLSYKYQLIQFWKKRITISSAFGPIYRYGGEVYFIEYIIIAGVNPQKKSREYGLTLNDLGTNVGMETRLKVYKSLFLNSEINYSNYFIGKDFKKNYSGGVQKNKNVLSATLSLGFSF